MTVFTIVFVCEITSLHCHLMYTAPKLHGTACFGCSELWSVFVLSRYNWRNRLPQWDIMYGNRDEYKHFGCIDVYVIISHCGSLFLQLYLESTKTDHNSEHKKQAVPCNVGAVYMRWQWSDVISHTNTIVNTVMVEVCYNSVTSSSSSSYLYFYGCQTQPYNTIASWNVKMTYNS